MISGRPRMFTLTESDTEWVSGSSLIPLSKQKLPPIPSTERLKSGAISWLLFQNETYDHGNFHLCGILGIPFSEPTQFGWAISLVQLRNPLRISEKVAVIFLFRANNLCRFLFSWRLGCCRMPFLKFLSGAGLTLTEEQRDLLTACLYY